MGTNLTEGFAKKNAVIRSLSDIPAKKRRKLLLGSIMVKMFAGRSKRIETDAIKKSWGAFDRLLRNGLIAKAYWSGNHALQRTMFSQYWAHEADDEPELWQERFEEEFLAHNVALIDAIEEHLDHEHFDRLYEIGCGHGQVVEYLAKRMKTISEFIGMDISEVQIEKNRQYYNHPKISFQAGDAVSWVQEEAKPRSIFLTNGGVFEYFL